MVVRGDPSGAVLVGGKASKPSWWSGPTWSEKQIGKSSGYCAASMPSFLRFSQVRRWFGSPLVALGSPEVGLQNPSMIAVQFGRNHKNPKARVSLAAVGFTGSIPSTTGHDYYNHWSAKEEKSERERLRAVEGHGVAGNGRKWPEKPAAVQAWGERNEERLRVE